jgi:hypothetical protein
MQHFQVSSCLYTTLLQCQLPVVQQSSWPLGKIESTCALPVTKTVCYKRISATFAAGSV